MAVAAEPKIPTRALIVSEAFGEKLSAERVATLLAAGISDRRQVDPDLAGHRSLKLHPQLEPEPCPIASSDDLAGCFARMRSARALIIAVPSLDEATMLGSTAFELGSEARQRGVPCFAVTAHNGLPPFDARILDLQAILQAASDRALRHAGRRLAEMI